MNMRGLLWIVVVGIASAAAGQGDPQRDFVISGKDAYMILPPEFLCGPQITQTEWSPDGDKLAVVREITNLSPSMISDLFAGKEPDRTDLEPEQEVIVWSSVTRKANTVMRLKRSHGQINEVSWLAGSSSLVIDATFTDPDEAVGAGSGDVASANIAGRGDATGSASTILIINGAGKQLTVARMSPTRGYVIRTSPNKPVAVLMEFPATPPPPPVGEPPAPREAPSIRFFGTDGVLSAPMKLPTARSFPNWSRNGFLYVLSSVRKPDMSIQRTWSIVDRTNQTIKPCEAPADSETMLGQEPPRALIVNNLTPQLADLKVGVNAPTVTIAAPNAKDDELSIVSTDGKAAELSPTLNAVSYQSQGSLLVRSMVKVPLEAYQKAKLAALKLKLINNAKQVALAMLMFTNDNGGNYASKDANLQNTLGPYLKNNRLLDGFNYTFGGGNENDIAEPANTIMGYYDGPGGRAVAYCDGHVKWVNNQP